MPSLAGVGLRPPAPTKPPKAAAGASRLFPMDEQTKSELWDLTAGTFIAVSVVSSLAYMIVSAI